MATTDGTSIDDTLQASKLRKARETRNLTLQQVAALCDPPVTQAQIWKLEKGLRQLTPSWAKRLARALRCEPSEITDEVSAEEWDMLRARSGALCLPTCAPPSWRQSTT